MTGTPTDERVDGRHARWAAHRSSRRAELVRAARRAVHHLGSELSMDDLAAEIGTSKSIIYRYFTDKSGLQSAVGAAVIEDLREALGEVGERVTRPRQRIAAMVEVYLGVVESSAPVYAFVTQPEATAGALRGFVAEIEDIVADALLPVLRPDGQDDDADHALAALWGSGVVGLVRGVTERWIAARGRDGTARDDVVREAAGTAHDDTGTARDAAATGEGTDAPDPTPGEGLVGAMDRAELTARITDWLWNGAAGVARRTRTARSA